MTQTARVMISVWRGDPSNPRFFIRRRGVDSPYFVWVQEEGIYYDADSGFIAPENVSETFDIARMIANLNPKHTRNRIRSQWESVPRAILETHEVNIKSDRGRHLWWLASETISPWQEKSSIIDQASQIDCDSPVEQDGHVYARVGESEQLHGFFFTLQARRSPFFVITRKGFCDESDYGKLPKAVTEVLRKARAAFEEIPFNYEKDAALFGHAVNLKTACIGCIKFYRVKWRPWWWSPTWQGNVKTIGETR